MRGYRQNQKPSRLAASSELQADAARLYNGALAALNTLPGRPIPSLGMGDPNDDATSQHAGESFYRTAGETHSSRCQQHPQRVS